MHIVRKSSSWHWCPCTTYTFYKIRILKFFTTPNPKLKIVNLIGFNEIDTFFDIIQIMHVNHQHRHFSCISFSSYTLQSILIINLIKHSLIIHIRRRSQCILKISLKLFNRCRSFSSFIENTYYRSCKHHILIRPCLLYYLIF